MIDEAINEKKKDTDDTWILKVFIVSAKISNKRRQP
jgi:hypothetical protein